MNKPIVYAPIPDFDQERQYVTQAEPEEREDCIYYGVVIHDLCAEDQNEEFSIPEEIAPPKEG